MPAKSQKQPGAPLAPTKPGKVSAADMATADLEEFAPPARKALPVRAPKTGRSKK